MFAQIESDRQGGESSQAIACYQAAIERRSSFGLRPHFAHCHTGLAHVYRRAGKLVEAEHHFQTAMSMYRGMGMRFWLEKAEKEIRPEADKIQRLG